jgi:hypothetical protein
MAVFSPCEQMIEGAASPCGASLVLWYWFSAGIMQHPYGRHPSAETRLVARQTHLPPANSEDFHKVSPGTSVDAMCNEDHVSYLRQQKEEA